MTGNLFFYSMTDNKSSLYQLKNKVEKLINLHEQMVDQHQQLKSRNHQLVEEINSYKLRISELEEKNKLIKLAQAVSGADQNTKDIKLKINEYIREIDKCLAMINR